MKLSFDYSKWDNLELSDDEDTHPGAKFIEENTLRRIKRESHEVKEQERNERIASLNKQIKKDKKRIRELEKELQEEELLNDAEAKKAELVKLKESVEKAAADVAREESERKYNAEEAVRDAWSHSLVGKACKPNESTSELGYEEFARKYGDELDDLAAKTFDYEDMGEWLKDRTHLLHEHAVGYLLLKCLYLEMEGKTREMRRAARAGYALKSVQDLAEAGGKSMKDAARPFFSRLQDERVFKDYEDSYNDYCVKLQQRAKDKIREEEEDAARRVAKAGSSSGDGGGGGGGDDEPKTLEELPREERLGPGGLDPVEVFETLPKEIQEAFESGSTEKLREYVNTLPMEEAKLHMRRMVDSGLWVPTPGQDPGDALRDD